MVKEKYGKLAMVIPTKDGKYIYEGCPTLKEIIKKSMTTITFNIDKKTKKGFQKICLEHNTTMTKSIINYIKSVIASNSVK